MTGPSPSTATTLGLDVIEEAASASGMVSRSAKTTFGDCTLWFDCVDNYAHADIWLEVETNDMHAAVEHLAGHGVLPQDELEPLPEGAQAHWISNPAGVPHILNVPRGEFTAVSDGVPAVGLDAFRADQEAAVNDELNGAHG